MQELQHTRYVAKQYTNLQGLASVPFGLLCLLLFAIGLGWITLPATIVFVCIVATIALMFAAAQYYHHSYGNAHPLRQVQRRDIIFGCAMVVLIIFGLYVDLALKPPFSLAIIILAVGIFAYYWPVRRYAIHYLVLAGLIFCIGLLPLLTHAPTTPAFLCGNHGCTLYLQFGKQLNLEAQAAGAEIMRFCLSYALLGIVGGLADHFVLKKAFTHAHND